MSETNQNDSFVLPVLTCLRCGHTWPPRKPELPKVCPKCKSPYWNQERQVKKSKKKDEKREYPPYLCCEARKRYDEWSVIDSSTYIRKYEGIYVFTVLTNMDKIFIEMD